LGSGIPWAFQIHDNLNLSICLCNTETIGICLMIHIHLFIVLVSAFKNLNGPSILYVALNRSFHRPGPINRVKTMVDDKIMRGAGKANSVPAKNNWWALQAFF
jgi:hypothetical protein